MAAAWEEFTGGDFLFIARFTAELRLHCAPLAHPCAWVAQFANPQARV
jgi:hypothetical protein